MNAPDGPGRRLRQPRGAPRHPRVWFNGDEQGHLSLGGARRSPARSRHDVERRIPVRRYRRKNDARRADAGSGDTGCGADGDGASRRRGRRGRFRSRIVTERPPISPATFSSSRRRARSIRRACARRGSIPTSFGRPGLRQPRLRLPLSPVSRAALRRRAYEGDWPNLRDGPTRHRGRGDTERAGKRESRGRHRGGANRLRSARIGQLIDARAA